jgi:carbon monoxide dehydrogenase subunit G
MQFTGRYAIPAPPEPVWAALNDPEVLRRCIPGCESLEKTGETAFACAAKIKIGPVSATFKGKVELTDLDPPRRCMLRGEGQGGVAGFARGEAEVQLQPEETGTILSYTAKATIGGKLAQVGQRLVDGAARQIADQFFERFSSEVATMQTAAADTATAENILAPPPQVLQQPTAKSAKREGLAPEIWIVGLIAIIAILLILFGLVL